jgi:hypothetical protein
MILPRPGSDLASVTTGDFHVQKLIVPILCGGPRIGLPWCWAMAAGILLAGGRVCFLMPFSSCFHAFSDIVFCVRVLPVMHGQYPYGTGSRGFLFIFRLPGCFSQDVN